MQNVLLIQSVDSIYPVPHHDFRIHLICDIWHSDKLSTIAVYLSARSEFCEAPHSSNFISQSTWRWSNSMPQVDSVPVASRIASSLMAFLSSVAMRSLS
jgi:hypothetical protein